MRSPKALPKASHHQILKNVHDIYIVRLLQVERILEVHHKKNGKREFLIHWKGWSNKFDSWEPEDNLNCSDLIKKFMDKVQNYFTSEFVIFIHSNKNGMIVKARALWKSLSHKIFSLQNIY